MVFWSVCASFIGLAFAIEAMGLFVHELNTGAAVFLLLLGAALDPTTRPSLVRSNGRRAASGLLIAAAGLLLIPLPVDIRLFGAAIWFIGLATFAAARGRDRGPATALAVGALLAGICQYGHAHSLLAWYAVQHASHELAQAGGRMAWHTVARLSPELYDSADKLRDTPLILGPTFSGIGVLALAVAVGLPGLITCSRPGRPARAALNGVLALIALAGVLALYFAYLGAFAVLPVGLPAVKSAAAMGKAASWWIGLRKAVYPFHLPALLPMLLAIPVAGFLGLMWRRQWQTCILEISTNANAQESILSQSSRRRRGRFAAGATICFVASVLAAGLILNLPVAVSGKPRFVALYERGFLNWDSPTKERYGHASSGMFGRLPQLIECMGWSSERIPRITAEALNGKHILIIINQDESLPKGSLDAIASFVAGGGSMLILGDHTFWKSGGSMPLEGPFELPLNEPLRQTHIRFAFDSADSFIGGWLHSLRFWPHPISAGLTDDTNMAGSVVGASLEIEYPATPLWIGRYGYSDPGDRSRSDHGYLGNLNYDPGEPLGDVVLAAAENVGNGRVVVIGDTSAFVNAIQVQTWPCLQRVFHWLGGEGQATVPRWREAVALGLLVILAGVVLLLSRVSLIVPLAVSAGLLIAGWTSERILARMNRPPPLQGTEQRPLAVVDLSHVGRHSLEGWRDDGVQGVYMNLARAGYFPIGLHDFDQRQVETAKLLITIAPTKPYSSGEVEFLRGYMDRGGTVVMAVGWEDRAGAESLLSTFDMRLAHRPLGRSAATVPGTDDSGAAPTTPTAEKLTPMFWKAWPVEAGAPAETILASEGQPIVVRRVVGRGQLVVIGDSEFLLNRNLEVENGAIMRNVRFFYWLLDRIMGSKS